MSLTFAQARDDILTLIKAAWDPTGFKMLYDDVADEIPTTPTTWARTTVKHNLGSQASLSGAFGTQRYLRTGLIIVQIFTPSGEGLSNLDVSAKIIADAFEGKISANGVWFRNVRFQEVGPDDAFFQGNVIIDFEYDEFK